MQSLEDPGHVEPEDFSDHTNVYAGQPGCLVWAAAIGGCAAIAGAMTSGQWFTFIGPMFVGSIALLAILARRQFRPVQTSAVFAAPGRVASSRGRAAVDVARGEAVVVVQRSTGTLVVAVHHAGPKHETLFFRGPDDERYRRFMQLWLAPREPAPRIFDDAGS